MAFNIVFVDANGNSDDNLVAVMSRVDNRVYSFGDSRSGASATSQVVAVAAVTFATSSSASSAHAEPGICLFE
jgi:hypothetical protein